ncbi:MAG: cytochrome c biogenesis protein CcsA [Dehalococcoidia bacterium]|nr:cytochrome c biogenesis protein CcsA [Dehalococcoidia bacterium]MCA9856427.1 cytochrome c biogenesis protein CcsA [Dehalococcoidia bacterium]MCB9490993.1 cytochrome c biogenesis protein CcsA [Dehalococcoidia bacterium]
MTALLERVYAWRWSVLPPITGVAMMAMIVGALVAAPREIIEGEVQRLMYLHVPAAIIMYVAFFFTAFASVMLLWKRDIRWDAAARASAIVGVFLCGIVLVTGAIWGKPIWGVYWSWDARLTSTLILFLIYCAYLLARSVAGPLDEQAARYAAIFAIIGVADIPIIQMSVRWWRTLHPQPIVFRPDPALPNEMLVVLLIGFVAVLSLATWLISLQTDTERAAQRVSALRAEFDHREIA